MPSTRLRVTHNALGHRKAVDPRVIRSVDLRLRYYRWPGSTALRRSILQPRDIGPPGASLVDRIFKGQLRYDKRRYYENGYALYSPTTTSCEQFGICRPRSFDKERDRWRPHVALTGRKANPVLGTYAD